MAEYTYQVARIRALETGLISDAEIEQLLQMEGADEIVRSLEERGWGDAGASGDPEKMLAREEEKIWEVISDLKVDMKSFEVLKYPEKFHDLKAAIKAVYTGEEDLSIFYSSEEDIKKLMDIVREKDFDKLPDMMRDAAREGSEALAHTGDGQPLDIRIDRACLDAMTEAGRLSEVAGDTVIREYTDQFVATTDVKIAVRAAHTGKSREFLEKALSESAVVGKDGLIKAASQGVQEIIDYIRITDLGDIADSLSEGLSAFERRCDDKILGALDKQKYETFTIGPVLAYVIARQNEIKTVRIIITGKANGLSVDKIKERTRKMYV